MSFKNRLKDFVKAHKTPLVHPPDVLYYEEHGEWPETMVIPEEIAEVLRNDTEGEALPPNAI